MENQASKKKIHYAWYILVVCFLMNMTVHVLVMQVASLYMVPMYQELEVPRVMLSLQSVLMAAGAVLTAPFWGKMYKKFDARVVLTICTAMTALCTIGRGFMPNMVSILVLAAVKGVFFTGNTVLPNSILLTAWFKKRRGFAVSTASLGISVGGVIFSPIVERLISSMGWRMSDKIVGLIMLVIMIPCTVFIVRSTPADKNLQPLGADEPVGEQAAAKKPAPVGFTMAEARRSPAFYVFLLSIFAMTFATGAALQLPAYLTDIGYGSAVAAKVLSAYMAVAIGGKLLLGYIIDRFGEKIGSIYICVVGVLAFLCFIMAGNKTFIYLLIVLYGLASGITSVLPALLTSKIFGTRDYGPIYGTVVSVNRFGGVIGTVLVSLLFDITGDYSIIWPLCAICMAATLVAIVYCMGYSEKKMKAVKPAV
ncbi:MFS transporter [Hungatella hathewayi]|uniref:MFS transporter n=1 Tax=Hungatella hathewayi TaxID=154046 RepID=UPI00210DCCFB|nr:MFS transporter [Hungatella hathewayi]MCQ5384524.1 MFS transporter [Hungatella hathewayi]